jgi:hypothetical protein
MAIAAVIALIMSISGNSSPNSDQMFAAIGSLCVVVFMIPLVGDPRKVGWIPVLIRGFFYILIPFLIFLSAIQLI